MAGPLHNLPEFDRPPVVETVLSAQFDPLDRFSTAHFGLFWERIRRDFPQTETKLALEPVTETFADSPNQAARPRFEPREAVPASRLWFTNQAGTEMIQLQQDRFIKNWRKAGDGDVYPRYERVVKPAFERDFRVFAEWLAGESLGAIRVNQCEVTYVNHIVAGEGWRTWADAAKIFSFLGEVPADLETGTFLLRLPITSDQRPVGRLFVEIHPAHRTTDNRPIYVMNLTARGMLGSGLDFFDLGRAAVVANFARLTTPAMHEIWGRRS